MVQVSRFRVIPKSSQWRLILDLSSPCGFSVNDGVDPSLCSVQYTTVDKAVGYILSLGNGALLAKIDMKQAYRNILVHPEDRHLLGMSWHGNLKVFIDTTPLFGLRSTPKILCYFFSKDRHSKQIEEHHHTFSNRFIVMHLMSHNFLASHSTIIIREQNVLVRGSSSAELNHMILKLILSTSSFQYFTYDMILLDHPT